MSRYINNDAEYIYVIPVVCNGAYNFVFVCYYEIVFELVYIEVVMV